MRSLISSILATLGLKVSTISTAACPMFWLDEPECPKSLIK